MFLWPALKIGKYRKENVYITLFIYDLEVTNCEGVNEIFI